MTHDARCGQEYFLSAGRAGITRWHGRSHGSFVPAGEFLGRLRYHGEPHLRVLMAAKLRTLTFVNPGLIGAKPKHGRVARNHVTLAVQPRHPKTVNDIAGFQLEQYRAAGG